MPTLDRQRRVDVDRDVAVGRQVRVEVRVERQVARRRRRRVARGSTRPRSGPARRPDPRRRPRARGRAASSAWAAVTIVRSPRALSMRDGREDDRLGEDALLDQPVAEPPGGLRVAHHHRRDRRLRAAGVEAEPRELRLEAPGVRPQPLDAARARPASPGSPRDRRRRRPAGGTSRRGTGGRAGSGSRAGPCCPRRSRRASRPPSTACRPGWRPGRAARSGPPSRGRPGPRTPEAWASSTMTAAPNASAASTIPGSGAMSPSIEKTPSVTTRISRYGLARAVAAALHARRAGSRGAPRRRACG